MGERQPLATGMHKVMEAPEGIITVSVVTGAGASVGVGEATAMEGGLEGGAVDDVVGTFC